MISVIIFVLLIFALGVVSTLIVLSLPNLHNATVYGFNMTQDLQNEERILELCMIDIQLDPCYEIYGGINTDFGEPRK